MASFIRLVDYNSSDEKEKQFFDKNNKFVVGVIGDFSKIPGKPIAYWVSEKVRNVFGNLKINDIAELVEGVHSRNNDYFLKKWYEVELNKFSMGFNAENKKWYPINKGGIFRKWFGNNEFVVNWEKDGNEIKNYEKASVGNCTNYFNEGITYTALTSNQNSFRYSPKGCLYDVSGPTIYPTKEINITELLSYLNSNIVKKLLNLLNPTLSVQIGDMKKIPYKCDFSEKTKLNINHLTQQCIDISKEEWDSREISWDFRTNELLRHKTSDCLEDAYNTYCSYWKDKFQKLHTNEEELNSIFIDIYDLADELTPDVPLEDITILKDEANIKDDDLVFKKDIIIKQFISYAVGCMFGRYSPDKDGLILAKQGETIDDFREKVPDSSFMPDDDNIIPILEDEYFTDDIVSRFKEFLKVTFGAECLAENLDFIAGALSKSKNGSKSSEKTIRNYFLKSFFKDHVKTYKKRPIYWLFTSGKGRGFNALVYMHRYDKTTLAKMRTDYLLELESKLDARMDMLSSDSAREKQEREKLSAQIEELAAYDEVLNNKALAYIDIDLDEGVVVNYAKFGGLVEKV